MNSSSLSSSELTCVGVVESIDPVARELHLRVEDGTVACLIVPPDCVVWLHGERVKFRLLQVGDHVVAENSAVMGKVFAHCLKVNEDRP